MGFELGRLVRGTAGALGARVAAKARELRRRARAAQRTLKGVGEVLRLVTGESATPSPEASLERPPSNAEPNHVIGPQTRAVVETMVEVLKRSGYREVRADVPGCAAPELVRGSVRSHRPSLAAIGGGRAVLVDVYLPDETERAEQLSRWHLFASAAGQVEGEFHAVVPSFLEGKAGREWVRRLTDATGIEVSKVWEI
jgi:hypothetical protein